MDDESGESMELMEEVPLKELGDAESLCLSIASRSSIRSIELTGQIELVFGRSFCKLL